MRYPEITGWSLERYRADLLDRKGRVGDAGRVAIGRLVETIGRALDHADRLSAEEVTFTVTSLGHVPVEDLPVFINEYTLGVGFDGAPIVVMGTEPAEDAGAREDVAWHAIYSVLVAVDSRTDILDRILADSEWLKAAKEPWSSSGKRPYHLQPNDFLHVERQGGSPTWKVVAEVVAPGAPSDWRGLLATGLGAPGLGDFAYQIDRSALPAKRSDLGAPPTEERVAFLTDALRLLRTSAQTLVLHGFGGRGRFHEWWPKDQTLIAAFLGVQQPAEIQLEWRYVAGRNSLGTLAHGDRKVLYTRALSNRVTPAYVEAVRDAIKP